MKHVVGFSGGIDSQACAGWALERFPPEDVILVNSDAGGNEHPLTTEHIQWYSEHVHPVVMLSPQVSDLAGRAPGKVADLGLKPEDALSFALLALVKGWWPSKKAQFCTYHLKLIPQLRWMTENAATLFADGYERYVGVRADESGDRKKLPARQWDETFDCYLNRPLLAWTKKECFDFCARRGEKVNPLYRMGFDRVGCAPCVNSSKHDVRNWAARFPEMIDKVRGWEKSVGRTFFRPMVPGMEINWVDDVVRWAKTARGGKQPLLPIVEAEAASRACSSKYGLCE